MKTQPSSQVALFAKVALGLSTLLLIVAAVPSLTRKARLADDAARLSAQPAVKGRVGSGTEVIAFFIASSTCGASTAPNLPSALSKIRASLAIKAQREGKRFIYAGVALDEKPSAGLELLKQFGPFDEVMSGGSWLGMGSVDLMVRGMPGPLALPQLLIIERDVKAERTTITVSADRVIARRIGFDEIFKLAAVSDPNAVVR